MVGSSKIHIRPMGWVEKLYIGILLVIFGGIVLHAPLSVGLGTLFPAYDLLIKSWKEILMLLAGVLAIVVLSQHKKLTILKEPLMIGIAVFALLHIASVAYFGGTPEQLVAGLMIDLRYILFFALVYIAMRLYPGYQKVFIRVGIAGALVVVVFALLQVFILPVDILKYIGYNSSTIMPYLTVDQNTDFIRINSTLRGPNPLGAYALMTLTILTAWIVASKPNLRKKPLLIVAVVFVGSIVALWASYSRSALLATVIALGIVLLMLTYKRYKYVVLAIAAVAVVVGVGGIVVGRDSDFISNVILHENPDDNNNVNSNDGHISSLQDGLNRMISQPFGAGVGSTGSASLYGNEPLVIENQYLLIAHEVGWLGLILFVMIFVGVLARLWQRRSDWLALGVFASGVGLAVIGLLLPVWVDDTVAIIWWGLAAVAIGTRRHD